MTWRLLLGLIAFFLVACESKLPGPLECEKMAYTALGRSPEDVLHSPKVRRLTERLVQGCLTVPFDKKAVSCAQSGKSFVLCAEELARRFPERKPNLGVLLVDLKRLGRFPSGI